MEQEPIVMEIGVLPADWEETVDYYSQILNLPPDYITEAKVLFHTSEYDLYLINLGSKHASLIAEKFPPTYFRVRDLGMVETIYQNVLKKIPGAGQFQKKTTILAYPFPAAATSESEARTITMASVVIKPKSECKAQVEMTLGVIHNPPY
ncbi:hypothetical protein BEN47_13050 [Hymenobacter lapidarius]|uniref:Uncharacterized protein n=1 Tax=Hymenobacter lapidarius TaxID=1908237 RepID=A0A1G1T6C2_9BACT|nr:hypothetical protein [Hymenobacter lapidarius]OGX86428.1 hypothetical protein BEN47_13050 [Hymenobacter lapidarius]